MSYPARNPGEFVSIGVTVVLATVLTVMAYFFIYLLNLNVATLIIGEHVFGFLMAMEPLDEKLKLPKLPQPKGWHASLTNDEGGIASTGVFIVRRSSQFTYDFSISRTAQLELGHKQMTIGDTYPPTFFSPVLKEFVNVNKHSFNLLTPTSAKISYSTDGEHMMNIFINQLFPYIMLEFNGTLSINRMEDGSVLPLKIVAEIEMNYLVLKSDELIYHCKFDKDVVVLHHPLGEITIKSNSQTNLVVLPVSFPPWFHLDSVTVSKIFENRLSKSYRGCISNSNKGGTCILSYVSEENGGQLVFIPSLTMLHVGKMEHAQIIGGKNFWHTTNCKSAVYVSKKGNFSVTYSLINLPKYDVKLRNRKYEFRLQQLIQSDKEDLSKPNIDEDDIHTYARKLYTYSNYTYLSQNACSTTYFQDVWKMSTDSVTTNGYILLSYYVLSMIHGTKFIDKYQHQVLELMKTMMNAYDDDQYFNFAHGFSNPSSYSEMMHAYYACYLIAHLWNDHKLGNYFRALLSVEIPTQKIIRFFGLKDNAIRQFLQHMVSRGLSSLDQAETYPVATDISYLNRIHFGSENGGEIIDLILPTLLTPLTPLTPLLIGQENVPNLDSYIDTTGELKCQATTYPRYIAFKAMFMKNDEALGNMMDHHLGKHNVVEIVPEKGVEQTLPLDYSNSNTFLMMINHNDCKYGKIFSAS